MGEVSGTAGVGVYERRDLELRGMRNSIASWFRVHPRDLGQVERPVLSVMSARLTEERRLHEQLLERFQSQVAGLRQSMTRWEEIARTDPLTGLPNRRSGEERLAREIERSKRFSHRTAVLMVDVDHFKPVNDQHGHPAGDALLKELAAKLKGAVRVFDVVCRWGGDEFMVLCPETNAAGAASVAGKVERIRLDMEVDIRGMPVRPRVSVGWAVADPGDDPTELLEQADAALYRAKTHHRTGAGGPPRATAPPAAPHTNGNHAPVPAADAAAESQLPAAST